MRRWNGWGDDTRSLNLPATTATLLERLVGAATTIPTDISLEQAQALVPPSRLPTHPLIDISALERLRHARGQSFPDLVALRSGQFTAFPDGVAFPTSSEDVRTLLDFAGEHAIRVIPYGGGTSVVGHINPDADAQPILTVDLGRLNRLEHLAADERLATFGAGVTGPDLEAQLRAHGYTLGHFPQSFEYSTLGGWIATRSSGQQSLGFGRIEQLWAGGEVETPLGRLDLAPFPASAAGPDVREMILGSEGRLGIITKATVRIRPVPEVDDIHAVFFPNWDLATQAVRGVVQSGAPLSMLRLSTANETMTNLALAGHQRAIGLLERGLAWRGVGAQKCMLLFGVMGSPEQAALSRKTVLDVVRKHRGVHLGRYLGRQWQRGRFRAPYLRNTLWERGYAVDTLETATTWRNVTTLLEAVETALRTALGDERVHVFTHLSHLYTTGSSIYTTFVFRLGADADATMARWRLLKAAACQAIVDQGGTISHQHGVGVDHRPYLAAEKGPVGMHLIGRMLEAGDPDGLLNPGKLIAERNPHALER